jgi:hypothetical protein
LGGRDRYFGGRGRCLDDVEVFSRTCRFLGMCVLSGRGIVGVELVKFVKSIKVRFESVGYERDSMIGSSVLIEVSWDSVG